MNQSISNIFPLGARHCLIMSKLLVDSINLKIHCAIQYYRVCLCILRASHVREFELKNNLVVAQISDLIEKDQRFIGLKHHSNTFFYC